MSTAPESATDAQVEAYADHHLEYDAFQRVTKMVAQGEGCSSCTGGQGSYTYTYTDGTVADPNAAAIDFNVWRYKTVETLPDGNTNTAYTNEAGGVMLKVFKDTTSGQEWREYSKFDAAGRVVLTAAPSAVSGYWEASGDLLTDPGAPADAELEGLRDAQGVVEIIDYGSITTATSSTAGDVGGYKRYSLLRRGENGSAVSAAITRSGSTATATVTAHGYQNGDTIVISGAAQAEYNGAFVITGVTADTFNFAVSGTPATPATGTIMAEKGAIQSRTQYFERAPVSGLSVYPVAKQWQYRGTGSGEQLTDYGYTWQGSTTQVDKMTVTLPTVTSAQNGPNTAASEEIVHDAFGRPVWLKDADGFITSLEYDQGTGAVIKQIVDVNTASVSNEPAGWTTPGTGGLHLTTTSQVDALGRPTKITDPNGNVTYMVYNDVAHEMRVYRGWDKDNHTTTGPIQITREDRGNKYTERLTTSVAPTFGGTAGNYYPTGTETFSATNIQSLSREHVNDSGQVIKSDRYHSMSGVTYSTTANIGTINTNYYRTEYAYDHRGRMKRVQDPLGTLTWTLYDAPGRRLSTWIGTDDTGALNGDPDGSGGANNMKKVSENQYDGGQVGDGHLTKMTAIPGGAAADRVTEMYHDWRGRVIATKGGVQVSESSETQRQILYCTLDNLGNQTACSTFDGDAVTIARIQEEGGADADGVPDQPSASLLRAKSANSFDEQGRVYHSDVYSVDPATGTVGSSLTGDMFYDKRGNVIKSSSPGGPVTKLEYDGAGRTVRTFLTDGGGDSAWSDADDVVGDKVIEQHTTAYDASGNAINTLAAQRDHDSTATGALADATGTGGARVSAMAYYYDAADRPTGAVNAGSTSTTYSRPSTLPGRSDTLLVSSYTYNSQGLTETVTDPRGIVQRTEYDMLGRTTKSIAAYTDGTPSAADDQTTLYTYNGNSQVLTLTADLPSGQNDQVTQYVYGVTTAGGSDINSNDLLLEVRYPDKSTGAAGTSNSDKNRYTYNALGQIKTLTDQNLTVHTYSHDVLGRMTSDAVTTLGSGVNGNVRRIESSYDTAGRLEKLTSYDAASAGTVVNQVQRAYNGLGQLTTEYQANAGAVNTGTTPKVQYAYDTTASSGILTKGSRLTSMTYPDGRVLTHNYTGSTLDDSIGRLTSISDPSATLESYSYLGAGTVVERKHPEPGLDLSYISPTGATGDAGDKYVGLDRFGRVVDHRWIDRNDPASSTDDTDADRFKHGYDRNGNRLYKENTLTAGLSELYSASDDIVTNDVYDKLNRLTGFQRGALTAAGSNNGTALDTVATSTRTQDWSLDALGNWGNTTGTAADAVGDGTTTQQRKHNSRNQLTAYDADGAGVGAETTLAYDSAGSMTTDESGQTFAYDAWGRVATVNSTGIVYKNDALGRRIAETKGGVTTDLYYSPGWQLIEERTGSTVKAQNVWSAVYIDALIERDTFDSTAGTLDSNFDSDGKLTAQLGATDRVRAIVQSDGKVLVTGYSGNNTGLARFNADGSLDATFDGPAGNGNGKFIIDLGGTEKIRAVALQSDGKIVIAGITDVNGTDDVFVARLNIDGSWDNSFDTDGRRIDNYGGADQAYGVAVDSQGRIVLAGNGNGDVLIARYTSAGAKDTAGFNAAGTAGHLLVNFNGTDRGDAVAIDGQDRIVVAGANGAANKDVILARLTSAGLLDNTFDTDGKVTTDFGGTADIAKAVAIDGQGKIVIGGAGGSTGDMIAGRYNTDGSLDTTTDADPSTHFSTDGKAYINFGTANDEAEDMKIDAHGRIVLAGRNNSVDFAVARRNADGSHDATFGTAGNGTVTIDFQSGGIDEADAVEIQPDGKIIVAGSSEKGTAGADFAVARLSGGGTRLYAMQDANFNTTAVADAAGQVVERYIYDAYGAFTVINPDGTTDLDGVRDVDMPVLWQGLRYDPVSKLWDARTRFVSSTTGRALQQDFAGYVDGLNLYQWEGSNPIIYSDPFGLEYETALQTRREGAGAGSISAHQMLDCFSAQLTAVAELHHHNPPQARPGSSQVFNVIDEVQLHWNLAITGSPRWPSSCYCCPDGSAARFEFVQEITSDMLIGGVLSLDLEDGIDHTFRGDPGGDNQPQWRPAVENGVIDPIEREHRLRPRGNENGYGPSTSGPAYRLSDSPTSPFTWQRRDNNQIVRLGRAGLQHEMNFKITMYKICGDTQENVGVITFGFRIDSSIPGRDNRVIENRVLWNTDSSMRRPSST